MDHPLTVPRLRVFRHSPRSRVENLFAEMPQAGPSRISPQMDALDVPSDDDDNQSTPKVLTRPPLESTADDPPETAASRLRSVLSKVPNSSSKPAHPPPQRRPWSPSHSDMDSDFEPPNMTTNATDASIAKESLKELFSRALRDDTPKKNRQKQRQRNRSNSIDASEVESSPRIEWVERERARHKGKRKSVSDEETDKSAKESEVSTKSSSVLTYEALRERLNSTGLKLLAAESSRSAQPTTRPTLSDAESGHDTDYSAEKSGDTAKVIRNFDPGTDSFSPPEITSTPMRSVQSVAMPSQIQMQSNLLDQDSEMQNMMKAMDSFDGDTTAGPSHRRYPFPAARPSSFSHPTPPDHDSRAHSKSHSAHNLPLARRVSTDLGSSSSRSSSLSAADFRDRHHDLDKDKLYERERAWNKPIPRSPGHTPESSRHNSISSPAYNGTFMAGSPHARTRRTSSASMHSFDGRSSIGSSVSSRSDHRDQIDELEYERIRERERNWNKPPLTRSTSSLSFHSPNERSRRDSFPNRPDSAQSFTTPSRRPLSWNPNPSSDSRPGSRASSITSNDRESFSDPRNPLSHERERNWNSNHPSWKHGKPPPRPMSPAPALSNKITSPYSRLSNGSPGDHSTSPVNGRRSFSGRSRTVSLGSQPARPQSPFARYSTENRLPRPSSPMPQPVTEESADEGDSSKGPSYTSRFGWSFPRNRGQLPPLELDDSPKKPVVVATPPSSRPSSRLSTTRPSHIPVRSPRKGDLAATSSAPSVISREYDEHDGERRRGHRRNAELLNGTSDEIVVPPRIMIEPVDLINVDMEDLVPTDIESSESDLESQVTSTPLARPNPLPESETGHVDEQAPPSPSSPTSPAFAHHHHELPDHHDHQATPISPPASPARQREPPGSPIFGLQTPPRRPQFSNTSKLEFQTPSPPHNMPDLPGPPSSSEDELEYVTVIEPTPAKVNANTTTSGANASANANANATLNANTNADNTFLGNLTSLKTPRVPGAWVATPAPSDKPKDEKTNANATPLPAAVFDSGKDATPEHQQVGQTTLNGKTPAPPGAWQATPAADSLRRKGILKVRFDVESNTSADTTLEEVPIVGPGAERPSDSISEVFPPISAATSSSSGNVNANAGLRRENRPSTPEKPVVTRQPKSPGGVRVLDAFGRETKEEEPIQPPTFAIEDSKAKAKAATSSSSSSSSAQPGPATPRNKSAVRIVDAMGREVVEPEVSAAEESTDIETPTSHNDALRRVRETVASMADDLAESDDSAAVARRDDQRLQELYRASQAARSTRKNLSDSLQKHKDADAELRAKYGSLRQSMQRSKLLPSSVTVGTSRYSFNFLNAWVLWSFLIIQVVLLLYMYRLSTIRAKRLFLTTYYDPYEPALFAHIPRSETLLRRADPSPSSVSLPFSVTDALSREGWKGLFTQVWTHASDYVHEWHAQIWDAWTQQPQTTAWPPT